MLMVFHWYTRYGSKFLWTIISLGIGLFLLETKGTAILELYYWVSYPLRTSDSSGLLQKRLTNARFIELNQSVAELKKQNEQLQRLLGYFEIQKTEVIVAPVIGHTPDNWWRNIVLGRGSRDGVEIGFVVTGIGGLVGRIVSVTPHTSRVLLITDPTSRVGVKISQTGTMGVIIGNASNIVKIRFFDKSPEASVGDAITTSPVSRLFPNGLPIGQIKSLDFNKEPAPEGDISLTVAFNNLEWVIIHPYISK